MSITSWLSKYNNATILQLNSRIYTTFKRPSSFERFIKYLCHIPAFLFDLSSPFLSLPTLLSNRSLQEWHLLIRLGSVRSQFFAEVCTERWQGGKLLLHFLSRVPKCPFQMANQNGFLSFTTYVERNHIKLFLLIHKEFMHGICDRYISSPCCSANFEPLII